MRVIQPPVGGAFGGKDDQIYQTTGQVAKLALLTGRPVQMTFSREESMIFSYKRNPMRVHIRIGADRSGKLRASKVDLVVDSGAYSAITPFVAWRGNIHAMGSYRYDACHVDTHVAYTNNGYTGAFRGFGNTETTACIEQAIDDLADRLGIDPIELRLMNCLRPGDETAHGQPLGDDVALVECLEHVRRVSDWDRKRREYGEANRKRSVGAPVRRGIGVACCFHGLSLGAEGADFAVSTMQVNDDNSITFTSGLTDYGTGLAHGLYAHRCRGARAQAGTHPHAPARHGYGHRQRPHRGFARHGDGRQRDAHHRRTSQQPAAPRGGQPLRMQPGAGAARRRALHRAAGGTGQLRRRGRVMRGEMGLTLSAHGRWDAPAIHWSMEDGTGKPYFAYHYGAQVAEVIVDTGTGKVDVTGIWASHNTGTVIFPQGILGQIYGGITQGLGYALMERVDFDQGYIQATNFDEYLIPTALDVPDIDGHCVEKYFSPGPFGAKNVAEPAMVPTAPAIVNAIFHATGRRIPDLPANLERVLIGHDLRQKGSDRACKLGLKQ